MSAESTVLVVDDEPEIADLMRDFLEAAGFAVVTAGRGEDALAVLAETTVDCILLDVMMPGMSGFETLRQIRDQSEVPVLFLSARQGDADKIRGLGLGADDYIVKSATPGEVVARIKAVLRRAGRGHSEPAVLDFGRLVIDVTAREVRVDGRPVSVTPREYELLHLLASHPRRAFGREELFERLWGPFGDRHTVTVHVARVREKIEEDPADPRLLVTVRGMGYRFEGERR
ncbi:MAG: response regulator transcription factor [Thermomicrobiales bacterium]